MVIISMLRVAMMTVVIVELCLQFFLLCQQVTALVGNL
jgi:hypothetical protein